MRSFQKQHIIAFLDANMPYIAIGVLCVLCGMGVL
jgi:hypothetical protein